MGERASTRWTGRVGTVWQLVRQSVSDVWANNLMELAAALAFYAVLSLFPLLLAATAVAAYVVEPAWAVDRLTALLQAFVPAGVIDAEPIVNAAIEARGRVGLFAIAAWIFAGRRILGALVTALNSVSDVDDRDETWRRRLLVEVLFLVGLGSLSVAALSAGPVLGLFWSAAGDDEPSLAVSLATGVLHALLLLGAFYTIYTVAPRGERSRRAALAGAAVATVLFLAARTLFLAVVDSIWSSFDLIYGPLALGALLLLWAWYIGMVVLFGGSLASHVKVMLVEGKSAGEAERRHVAQKAA
jgi:membrane protein